MVQLVSVTRQDSPLLPGFVRVTAAIRFDGAEPQEIWFDVPRQYESYLSGRGEPWLVLLLPCAMIAGEDITLDLPVDPELVYNLKGVQLTWQSWYGLNPVRIRAKYDSNHQVGSGSGLFFSGGVDSYFSIVGPPARSSDNPVSQANILIMVWGFDIALVRPEEFALARELGEETARRFGKQFLPIATNLRELHGFDRITTWWTAISHGAALAGIGHLLANGLERVSIASSHDYAHLQPWGSHPMVDPLFSSGHFQVIHDGAQFTRVEKTMAICNVPEAAAAVRVCYRLGSASNCSKCSKCLRTMMTFDLFDSRHLAKSFDWSDYRLANVEGVFLRDKNDIDFFLEIRDAALERGRPDIVKAIGRSLQHSRWKRGVNSLSKTLKRTPVLWRYAEPLRHKFGL